MRKIKSWTLISRDTEYGTGRRCPKLLVCSRNNSHSILDIFWVIDALSGFRFSWFFFLFTFTGLLRSGKSCRLRWVNYLKPGIKRGNFSREEEEIILKLHEKMGNRQVFSCFLSWSYLVECSVHVIKLKSYSYFHTQFHSFSVVRTGFEVCIIKLSYLMRHLIGMICFLSKSFFFFLVSNPTPFPWIGLSDDRTSFNLFYDIEAF